MELRHLRYFVAVAGEENVSRAALKLHVSQPGVSRQIRDLEAELGFPLFDRGAKSLRLTAAGKSFFAGAREVLRHAEAAVAKARNIAQGGGGEIHVGYAPSLTVQILPPALRRFQQEFPQVRVKLHDLSTEEMLGRLRDGQLQVALLVQTRPAGLRGLKFLELARYRMCAAVAPSHPLARRKTVMLEQVAREPLVAYSRADYPEYHEDLAAMFAGQRQRPRIVEEHDGVTSLVAAVEGGRGIALVPDVLACMVGPRLKLIPLRPGRHEIVVGAAWRPEKLPLVAEKFISLAQSP